MTECCVPLSFDDTKHYLSVLLIRLLHSVLGNLVLMIIRVNETTVLRQNQSFHEKRALWKFGILSSSALPHC